MPEQSDVKTFTPPPSTGPAAVPLRATFKKYAWPVLRVVVAAAGLAYVIAHLSLTDRVLICDPVTGRPVQMTVTGAANEGDARFVIAGSHGSQVVTRNELVSAPHRRRVELAAQVKGGAPVIVDLLAVRAGNAQMPSKLLIADSKSASPRWISSTELQRPEDVAGVYPLLDVGLAHMVRDARGPLLWLSLLTYGAAILLTTFRWNQLMAALDVRMTYLRAMRFLLVGSFYNSFMPGSTGGDVVRAYEASRHTTHRTRAVVSVLVDRGLGLLALVILGGAMAAYRWLSGGAGDPAAPLCRRVALGSLLICACFVGGLTVFYLAPTRRAIDALLARLPMRKQTGNAVKALDEYRQRPGSAGQALLLSFPAHGAVVLSAMFAGMAMGLPLSPTYYFVAVPMIVLAGVIPIAPQGVGVMEFLAVMLTQREGVAVGQALALTLAIRVVPMVWSLVGAWFVLRGTSTQPDAERAGLGMPAGAQPM